MKRPERTYTPPTTLEGIALLDALNVAYGTPWTPQEQTGNTALPVARVEAIMYLVTCPSCLMWIPGPTDLRSGGPPKRDYLGNIIAESIPMSGGAWLDYELPNATEPLICPHCQVACVLDGTISDF